jgi:hypothetical protein
MDCGDGQHSRRRCSATVFVLTQDEACLLMYCGRQGGAVCSGVEGSWEGRGVVGQVCDGVLLFELYDEVFDDGRTDPCDECRPLTRAPLRASC